MPVNNFIFLLLHLMQQFNGSPLSVPFRSPTGEYSVAYEGSSVRYTSAFGFTVWFLTNYRVNVEVTSDLRSQLTGLCGNFDGNARNDLQVNGLDVSSLPDPGNAVGNSFIVQENQTSSTTFFESWFSTSPSAPTTSPLSPTTTMLSPDIQTPDTCPAGNAKFRLSCSQFGDLSGLFSTCLKLMDAVEVSAFVESCQFDVDYTCEGADVVKQAYLTLTLDCYSRFGVTIQHDVEPDCNCVEPNTVCMATAPGCPATCDNPTHPSTCIQPDAKYVCACQPGFLLFNGRCVPPTDCGCVYTDGRFFKKGDSWISQDCKLKLTCSAPNIYTSGVFSCPAGRACVSGACLACTNSQLCGTNGDCIETSTTKGYVCKCKPGFMGDTCNFSLSKATYSRTHCTTFDKATFDFKGIGNFLFAKSTLKAVPGLPKLINFMEFEVRAVNVYLVNTKEIAYAKILIINFLSHHIVIDRDLEGLDARITVTVDGNIVNLPYNSTDFEIVWNSLSSVDFSSNLGSFVVTYGASDSTITVTIPSSYFSGGKGLAPPNGLTGVCGGFDGIPDNDLVTADNRSVASSPDPGFEIGLSYTDKSDPYFKNLTSLPNEVLSKECSNATLLNKCNLIQSALFRPLLVTLGVSEAQTFVKNCIADVTRLCNLDAFCTAAERVAKLAEALGFVTEWRNILGCPLQCPPGQIFSPRSTGCPETCDDPDAPATCTEPDLIGECVCPPGQVLFKDKCVNRTSCGCADVATGRFYEIGQSWRSLGCAKKMTCTEGGNVTQVTAGNCSKGFCVGNRCSGCTPNPCLYGGQCIETSEEGDFICKCPPGVFGKRCGGSNSQADIVIMIEDGPADCNPAENNFNSCVFGFYRKILNFLSSFVANLPLGGGDIRIAGVSFSSQPQLLWSFDDYTKVADLQTAINQVTLGNANQPINLAISIDFIISQVFQISNIISTTIRTPTLTLTPPAPKILLIFTDAQPKADASKIGMVVSKLATSGVQVYTFGLTSRVDVNLLGQISSSPKQKYANFFPSFMDISVDVLKQILKIVDLNVPSPFNGKNPFDPNGPLPKFPQLTAKCKCTGDTHCKTFDGLNLDYQGTCKTLLSSNNLPGNTSLNGPNITAPPFSVYIHNYHREPNSKVAWVRNVEVVLGAKVIRFIKIGESYSAIASVTVDGVSVEPPHVNNDFTIIYNADGLELRTTDGSLVVGYNVNGMASVDIPNYLTKKVYGICGNFDGNQGNDLVTKDGQDVSGMRDPGKFVGDSYIVMGDVDNAGIMDSCKPPAVTNQTCSPSMKELTMKCNLLTDVNELFGECINKVGRKVAQIFQYDCLFDLQQTCDESVVEPAIFQFVLYCFQYAQVDIPDWRRKLKFPCRCSDDKICIPKGPPCQPNFFFPDKSSVCALPDAIDVCTCPPRKVLFNGVCVDLQQAGCIDAEGRARKTGEIWLSKDCTQLLTCAGLNNIKSEATSCPDQTSCFNGKCSACVAAQPCLNGGSCLETLTCQDKSPTNPGCYWKKFANKKSLASTSSGLSAVSQLADCFQACYQTSRTDCMGINWNPSANMGQRCGLVVKAGGDLVDDVSFTYYEWTCSTSGTCMLSEGPQISTFDGFSLLYRAPCMIILTSFNVPTLPTFSVASKNVPAWKQGAAAATTWTREIMIQWNGRLIKFKSDGLGIPKCDVFDMLTNVKLPYTAPFSVDDISVQVVGADLEFSTSSQIKVGLAKSGRSYIIMPPTYSGKVMGTCGNFDGVKENDGIPFSGSLAGSAQSGFTGIGGGGNSTDVGNSVGNSYYVSDFQYPYLSNCSVPDLSNTSLTPVPPIPLDKSRCDAIVSANSSFAACVALLDPAMVAIFVNTCKFNVDFFLNDLLSCTALESFVDLCKLSVGVSTPSGWRETFKCKCQCAPGFVCAPSSPACPATCNNPDAPKTCLEPELQDVCVCPAGKLLLNGTCVLPSMCGCVDGFGTARKTLEKWLNLDCSMEYTCARNGTTSSVPFTCPAGTLCTAGVCSACASNNPCQNNGTCIDVMNSPNPICKCLTGFAGKFCEYSGSNNTCTISGNGHLLTFDGASLDFGGDCKFLLLQSLPPAPLFKVFGKNFVINKNAAFLRYVEIETAIGVLRLERPELSLSTMGSVDVSMNGSLIHLPLKGDQWEVAYRGQKVEWRTDFGVSILYHNWQAIIKLPSQFAGSLIGLCGNFDGSKDNDMMQLNRRPPVSTTKPGQEIANSFIVNDLEAIDPNSCMDLVNNPVPVDDPVAPPVPAPSGVVVPAVTGTLPTVTATVGPSSSVTAVASVTGSPLSFTATRPVGGLTTAPNLTQPPTPPAGCQLSAFEINKYTLLCTQVIDVHAAFAACANVLGSNLFIQAQTKCQLDVVLTCSADMFTLAFSSLVVLCQEVGVVVTVNSTANFTLPSPSCPVNGMVLNPAPSSPCLATCADLDAPKHCTFPDEVNVCSCPPGFVFSSKRCIPRNQCGCVSKTGMSYNVGSVWFETGCTKKYTCLGPSEIKEEENKSGTCILFTPHSHPPSSFFEFFRQIYLNFKV
ncbi:hypothetical protein HELRODRAFT_189589 [Helobdella robusta]|uniref:Uncharacterized protein n=1 Tax=Helobdella robusta TaxID=6412 RepID=T1FR64_HELRO|nr:hypothetical protein HELRODRAFT_189589 [Helobdella robusta]ESN92723.1 hypothetical protein HELRODRAFT_189589 [Helobdella robusta]